MQLTKRLPVLFAFALLLAACGGAATPTATTPTATTLTPTTTDTTPSATESGTDPGGGGGGGGDNACLNTVEEVSAAFGVTVTEAENTPNPGGGGASCTYYTDKAAFEAAMAVSLTTGAVAQTVFDNYAADDSAETVSGIGDAAVWFGDNKVFFVLKGDNVLGMSASSSVPAAGDEAAIRAILEGLARSAVNQL